ncbi:MAG: helix-turn-helix domain-containing protein [Oscillospiraceae bacterium]|nr:helix-turn-helix domain-containing protein [Oscillospiraceae bacterium]
MGNGRRIHRRGAAGSARRPVRPQPPALDQTSEYIQAQRVELAKQLLCCTRKKVSEIALSVGYPHFSQFSTLFKKHTGMTPQAYRAKHGKNVPQS